MKCEHCNERFNYEIIGSGTDEKGDFTDIRCETCEAVSRNYEENEDCYEGEKI